MNASTERVLGDYGTVEEAYKPKAGKRYSTAQKPSARLAGTAVTGTVPTAEQRRKRERIAKQQARNAPAPRKPRGGNPRYVEYIGRTYDDLYGVKVKITGISADTYWLPWSKASELWYEMSGTDLQDYLG